MGKINCLKKLYESTKSFNLEDDECIMFIKEKYDLFSVFVPDKKWTPDRIDLARKVLKPLCNTTSKKFGRDWAIPYDTEKPNDNRIKSGEYIVWRNNIEADKSIKYKVKGELLYGRVRYK